MITIQVTVVAATFLAGMALHETLKQSESLFMNFMSSSLAINCAYPHPMALRSPSVTLFADALGALQNDKSLMKYQYSSYFPD